MNYEEIVTENYSSSTADKQSFVEIQNESTLKNKWARRVLSYISKSHFESLVQNYFDYTRPKYFFNSVQWQTSEQTKDQEDIALEIDLDTDANNDLRYENADLKVSSFSESKAVLDLIIDEGEASENVKELGYCQTSDRLLNDYCNIKNNFVIVPSGSVSAKLRVRVTPFEGALGGMDEILISASINKVVYSA